MPFVIPSFLRHLPGFFLLTSLVILTACATHDQPEAAPVSAPAADPAPIQPPPVSDAKVFKPESKPVSQRRPRSRPRATSAATPRPTPVPDSNSTPAPIPQTVTGSERAQALGRLVTNGQFLRSEEKVLVFTKTPVASNTPSGLFEDAIILGRLRSRLNQISGLPVGISESATVKDATAELTAPDDLSTALCAKVIDAALTTEGIGLVRVRF